MKELEEIIFKALKKIQKIEQDGPIPETRLLEVKDELIENIHTIYNPVKAVTEAIKNDPDLYYAWQSNIVMSFKDLVRYNQVLEDIPIIVFDENQVHELANQAAKNFINLLCDIKPVSEEIV